jgi:site-specific recombinase XerD
MVISFTSSYLRIFLQMPEDVSKSLATHIENVIRLRYTDGYVFHSFSAPYGRITTSIIRHTVTNHIHMAGIDIKGRKHGPHAFCSSLASSMVNDDIPYETVRKILGHRDPDAIKHYAKADIERLRFCAIEAPTPQGIFHDYLCGRRSL